MHYLFSQKSSIKESEAMLIITLLLDLQEDFRMAIKQSTIRFLMRFGFDFDLAQKNKFHFLQNACNSFLLVFKVQRAVARVWIGNGSKSNRISNCNDTWSSPMEMQLSIGQQSSRPSFNGNPSGVAGNESSLVRIVSYNGIARMHNISLFITQLA